jgi:RNA polymerase sigma factor (sigma-70 family)
MVVTMNVTDEALMIAVREGSCEQLEILFERHHRMLYEFFYWMTADRAASESLVQDVFYRILTFRDTFRDEGQFKSWLFRIARDAHHDAYLKQEVAFTLEGEPASIRKVSPTGGEVVRKNKSESLRDALLQLPEERRELVVFSQHHQLSTEEIADLLDIDAPTAKVDVHRAMMELRDLYRTLSG